MIKIGDKITYQDGYIILVTNSDQCILANTEYENGQIKNIERVKWKEVT